jgi:hypothetical protein
MGGEGDNCAPPNRPGAVGSTEGLAKGDLVGLELDFVGEQNACWIRDIGLMIRSYASLAHPLPDNG